MHFDDLRQALCSVVTVPITPFEAEGRWIWRPFGAW